MNQNSFVCRPSGLLHKIQVKYIRVVSYLNQHKFDALKVKSNISKTEIVFFIFR